MEEATENSLPTLTKCEIENCKPNLVSICSRKLRERFKNFLPGQRRRKMEEVTTKQETSTEEDSTGADDGVRPVLRIAFSSASSCRTGSTVIQELIHN